MESEILKLLTVFIAGAFGAVIGPYFKGRLDKKQERKIAKFSNRPEVYEEFMYFLIHKECSANIDISTLKVKLLTYARDDVIEKYIAYLDSCNNKKVKDSEKKLHELISYIRKQLKMGTNFSLKELKKIMAMSGSTQPKL